MIADMDADVDVVLEEANDVADDAKDVDIVTIAKIITKVVIAASTTITAADVPIPVVTTAAALTLTIAPRILVEEPKPLKKRTKGVVIRDLEESTTTTTSTIIHSEAKSKDKEAELNRNISWDEFIDHVNKKEKEDKSVKRYQAMKRKPQTEAQARKNMMVYLKNVAGFKMDYFKGMSYDDIQSKALKRINETPAEKAAKRQKLVEEVKELKRNLQIVPNEDDDVYTKATPLAHKVPVVDYKIYNQNNKPYYKIKRADSTHQLYISILKRKYPLTKFTLNQMLNNVRLDVEEESEVSLELLRFIRQQHQEGAQLE
nr:hypothetical protein [Tanacetum cinerariifolium]